ncbi:competence type IV pilus minor pilin ComGF [Ammoniphilus resinae]|uniref:Competence protein ComGF n=1 Tax=Ammoniphilus resinae TaxID=861532 RepID=A0ABS4GRE5_9BACL|nr:competence type IV pilus minor pilin ComGF [Ammoniphilus resinae]MBP1932826.1 competence protein ComGF [Ammoniphilus resinae]
MDRRKLIKNDIDHGLQAGITLIELVISTGLLMLILGVVLHGTLLMKQRTVSIQSKSELQHEAMAFFQYLEDEASCAEIIYPSGQGLYFSVDGSGFGYRWRNQTIVREKDGKGYVTVCYFVKGFSVQSEEQGVWINLTLGNQKEEREFRRFIGYQK